MNILRDFESVITFVNSVENSSASVFYIPLSILPELIEKAAYLFDDDYLKAYKADAVGTLDKYFANPCYYQEFETAGCGKAAIIAAMYVNTEGNTVVRVGDLFQVLEYEGTYYNIYKTSAKRFGLSVFGGAKNVRNIEHEGRPNYFSKPTESVFNRWVQWLNGCELKNVEEIEKVKALHAQVRADIAASGLEYRNNREGLSVDAGPITVDIRLSQSGVSYEYRVNYKVIGYGAEGLTTLLAKFGKHEQPKEDNKPKAYNIFKALTVETVEGSERWTDEAVRILEAASADSSEVVADICSRALAGITRLSDKQRWCVAYAYTRAM